MRRLFWGLAAVLLVSWVPLQAKLSVSPVIIEAEQVKAGQSFAVLLRQEGQKPLELELSWALFDQDPAGSVVLLEDPDSVKRAEGLLAVEPSRLVVQPGESVEVAVRVLQADFQQLYAALLVRPVRSGPPTRLAVLFLLSTGQQRPRVGVAAWERSGKALTLTLENSGLGHGLWEGELLLFDAAGQLGETRQVQSGLVLPGRCRGLEVSLPGWVENVEIRPLQLGEGP